MGPRPCAQTWPAVAGEPPAPEKTGLRVRAASRIADCGSTHSPCRVAREPRSGLSGEMYRRAMLSSGRGAPSAPRHCRWDDLRFLADR